jgi:hypothetical protein
MLFPVPDICTVAAIEIQYETFLYVFWCLWYSCLPTYSPYILDCCSSAMAESCWMHRKSSTLPMWSIPAMHPVWWVHKILPYMSLCLKMILVMPPVAYSKLSVRVFCSCYELSYGMWHCVSRWVFAGVVKDHGAFIGPFLGLHDPEDEGNAVLGYTGNHSPKDVVSRH